MDTNVFVEKEFIFPLHNVIYVREVVIENSKKAMKRKIYILGCARIARMGRVKLQCNAFNLQLSS